MEMIKEYDGHKYRIITHDDDEKIPENTIIAAATFAGKVVFGRARCHPSDTFNFDTGVNIAVLRCALKIADKRRKYAHSEYAKNLHKYEEAKNILNRSMEYAKSSTVEYNTIKKDMELFMTGECE